MNLSSLAIDPRDWVELEDEGSRHVPCAEGVSSHHRVPAALFSPLEEKCLVPGDVFERSLTDKAGGSGQRSLGPATFTASSLAPSQVPDMYVALAQDVPRQLPMARPFQGQINSSGPVPLHSSENSRIWAPRGRGWVSDRNGQRAVPGRGRRRRG